MSRRSSRGGTSKKSAAAAAAAPAPSDDAQQAAAAEQSTTTAGNAATTTTNNGDRNNNDAASDPSDEAVLAYLRKRGLDGAAIELGRSLRAEKRWKEQQAEEAEAEKEGDKDKDASSKKGKSKKGSKKGGKKGDGDDGGDNEEDEDEEAVAMDLDEEDKLAQHARTPLVLSTGGGMGYDLDSAPHMAMWGCGDGNAGVETEEDIVTEAISGVVAADADADATATDKKDADDKKDAPTGPPPAEDKKAEDDKDRRGQDEARKFVRAFTALQTWVLSLPDDAPGAAPHGGGTGTNVTTATVGSVVERAQQVAAEAKATAAMEAVAAAAAGDGKGAADEGDEAKKVHVIPDAAAAATTVTTNASAKVEQHQQQQQRPQHHAPYYPTAPQIAPSCKPELLAVTFAALVHTYCELLEFNLDHTAASLLATYRHIYEPSHHAELADLDVCKSNAHVVELNKGIAAHGDAVTIARAARQAHHSYKKKKVAVLGRMKQASQLNSEQKKACIDSIRQIDAEVAKHEAREKEASKRASKVSARLATLPFLRRARALRWHMVLSTHAYHLLASYLGRGDGVLLPMSSLLLSRCHFSCEKRDPLPVVPSVVLEDMFLQDDEDGAGGAKSRDVRWAAPVDPTSRAAEEGEDLRIDDEKSILTRSEPLPFPKFYLDPNTEVSTEDEAKAERRRVEFNRALLINGFRRLEALECRREYEAGMRVPGAVPKSYSANTGKVISDTAAIVEDDEEEEEAEPYREYADPHSPSILLSTLCAARPSSGPSWSYGTAGGVSAAMEGGAAVGSTLLQESGIDICCAKLCPPDRRRVAAGCDDAAVRIWTIGGDDKTSASSSGGGKGVGGSLISSKGISDTADTVNKPEESAIVLLGHKNGFPIFDLDWNRDGRTLLSAGGDGSIRLWDTSAVGPFGRLANVVKKTHPLGTTSTTIKPSNNGEPNTSVPGMRTEPMVEVSGAALAYYRGHSPSSPIWSVSFAPSGYFFASAGWDSTARIWTTDNSSPVRILAGHFSPSVNSIDWHPNANYVATAADDKTVRLWDVQTGRCVRLLNGVSAGLNLVKICPSGKYAAASDYSGVVHIWDLGSGRKVNELRLPAGQSGVGGTTAVAVQSMSYSACGTALATGGDDCTVRIWDVRGAASHMSNPDYAKSHGYGGSAGSAGGSGSAGPMSLPTDSQLSRRPIGEQFRLGAREPVKCFRTRRTIIMDLQYTKANLLLSVGKYSASAGL